MSIKVAIVEDDPEVRAALALLFRKSADFQCVAACESAEEALKSLPPLSPDVVLLDIHLPGQSGIQCLPTLKSRCPTAQICMQTVLEDAELVFQSLEAGATGYLLKKTPPAQMLESVKDLHVGGSPMSSQIARKVVTFFAERGARKTAPKFPVPQPAANETLPELGDRERQILSLLAKGHRYKEIADELGITIHTVRTFIRRMYEKLQVHSRTEALLKMRK